MADLPPPNLAKPDDPWYGIRPGMTREQVHSALHPHGIELDEYGTDNGTIANGGWELDLAFTNDGADRVWQMTLCADEISWNSDNLADARLDSALSMIGSPATAVWESKVEVDPSSIAYDAAKPPPNDEELLEDGTVWIPERALGLVLFRGEIMEIAWRDPQHLPKRYGGTVTSAQRELSKRPDLENYFQEKRTQRAAIVARKKDPLSVLRTLITIAAVAGGAWTVKLGFEDDQFWKQAPTLPAKLVAVEKIQSKQFRDFVLPPLRWIFPPLPPPITDHYRVEFTPPGEEMPRQAVLERGEFYVTPDIPGAPVDVVYIPGDPPRVKGPFRARDAGFVDYTPTIIALGGLWLILTFGIGLILPAFRIGRGLARRLVPPTIVKDPNRPELR